MVIAKLHIICGNCGNNEGLKFRVDPKGRDLSDKEERFEPEVYIKCPNCSTLHSLSNVIDEDGGKS